MHHAPGGWIAGTPGAMHEQRAHRDDIATFDGADEWRRGGDQTRNGIRLQACGFVRAWQDLERAIVQGAIIQMDSQRDRVFQG
jgi:hypothetical protein